ncbi:MAG: Hydrazine dehydrogenase [Calditrichaeota bacterium]|nr:Hydrazine dehydrogenase [Calditrichota bacterium]
MRLKPLTVLFLTGFLLFASGAGATVPKEPKKPERPAEPEGKCMTCHKEKTSGLYYQWRESEHALHNVTCFGCHGARKDEPDAFVHEGAYIATMVTPKDCGQCHKKESEQFQASHHAKAGQILDSNDAYLAHVIGGNPVAIAGCASCHGAKMEIDPGSANKLKPGSWPNSGIGRINPDGSLGSCNACHVRHKFSRRQARQPETCGKCHLGPDHPQKEVYEESKHGITYYTNMEEMNLDAERWVVGEDYSVAPTCATCHLSATKNMPVTHDAGERISWNLRAPVSHLQDDWRRKRQRMQRVCRNCHGSVFYEGHYRQLDGFVNLYNEKFAKPATRVMEILRENGSLENEANFSNEIEWIYWELWHHEGRRARHGAAMMGPDYAWWHGVYELGKHFYFKFIPAVRETGDEEAIGFLDDLLANDPMHNWMNRNTDELKRGIKSGELQELYEHMFTPNLNE